MSSLPRNKAKANLTLEDIKNILMQKKSKPMYTSLLLIY